MEVQRHYASDLTDRQWQIIRLYLPRVHVSFCAQWR